jgi:hypothetical protein
VWLLEQNARGRRTFLSNERQAPCEHVLEIGQPKRVLDVIELPHTDCLSVVLEYRADVTVHVAVVRRTEDGH